MAHRTRATVGIPVSRNARFFAPNLCPPNSPDLIPVDYEIWAVMQHRVHHKQTILWMN